MRRGSALLVEHLAELDRRGLPFKRGFGSLYEYSLFRLKMSEGSAYRHIRAARAIQAVPALLELLRDAKLSIEALALLHPHLNAPDAGVLLQRACGMRTRQIEAMLAERGVASAQRDMIRYVGPRQAERFEEEQPCLEARRTVGQRNEPQPLDSAASALEKQGEVHQPAEAPEARRSLVRLAFTVDASFMDRLARAKQLLRHKYPNGRLDGILGDALRALLEKRDPFVRWANRRAR